MDTNKENCYHIPTTITERTKQAPIPPIFSYAFNDSFASCYRNTVLHSILQEDNTLNASIQLILNHSLQL